MGIKFEGYGYEWDAELIGGPCDGLVDRAVQLQGKAPPEFLVKILGRPMKQSKIGEKVIEDWQVAGMNGKRVAVYQLEELDEEADKCQYSHVETMPVEDYRIKYL